jgi:chromosome segregation ATPase
LAATVSNHTARGAVNPAPSRTKGKDRALLTIELHVTTLSPDRWRKNRAGYLMARKRRRLSGEGIAMTQAETLQQATKRLDAAVDSLEKFLRQVFPEGANVAEMQEQVRFLADERDQLLLDLDAERDRVRRLKAANEEVAGRLEAVMGTLKDMMPAAPG